MSCPCRDGHGPATRRLATITCMTLTELKQTLAAHPDLPLRFVLPDGQLVPAHAHVTEVARVDKHFVDCGGTRRAESYCRLQVWVADDTDHRLPAAKLHRILGLAGRLAYRPLD